MVARVDAADGGVLPEEMVHGEAHGIRMAVPAPDGDVILLPGTKAQRDPFVLEVGQAKRPERHGGTDICTDDLIKVHGCFTLSI